MKIKAALLVETGKPFVIEEIDLDEPKANEVLVKVIAAGVCHTDEEGRSHGVAQPPAVLGHEGAGIVEKTGPGVTAFKPGDHVVITYASCGECASCKAGQPFVCERFSELNFLSGKLADGTTRLSKNGQPVNVFFGQSTFATYAIASVHSIVKVDDEVDIALLGPLGCGFQTGAGSVLGYMDAQPGQSLVVMGIGSLGMVAVMAAKIAGFKNIIAVGGTPDKLKLALELGATHALNRKAVNFVEEVLKITGRGAEYIFDTTGSKEMIETGMGCLGPLGKMVLVGAGPEISINPSLMMANSQSVSAIAEGCVDPKQFIPRLVQYYKEGKFPIDRLITFYDLEDIDQAFEDSAKGKVIKPILRMKH